MSVIVGSGDFKYELVDSWPNMPRYWAVSYTHLTLPPTPYE